MLQIAAELDLSATQAHEMIMRLRQGIADHQHPFVLEGEVECDEVNVVAGHKGHPEAVKKRREGRRRRLKGARGRGTLEKEKPPIFGMIHDYMYYGPPEPNREHLQELLDKIVPINPNVACERHLLFNDPAHQLVEFANTQSVDLIVIGTHGRTGLFQALLGSVAESVVRHATCPVITVKHPKHKPAEET